MDERAVVLAEARLRRSLGSLDGIAVPTLSALSARHRSLPRWRALFAPLVISAVVLVAALALGDALATWRADRGSSGASAGSPTASARTSTPSPRATTSPLASETVTLPTDCPADTTPELKIDVYPQGNEHGGATPSAAFTAAYPTAGPPAVYKFGTSPAPVWIVAGNRTFIATVLPDGSWFVSPATFVRCNPLPAQRYLDVDGYRFMVTVISDARYGGNASAAAYVSAVEGVGVRCDWGRIGADVPKATDLWGTPDLVVSTATYSPVRTGVRTNGVPVQAVHGRTATMVCGIDDETGGHGVVIDLAIAADGNYTIRSLTLTRWSGILGDAAAVTPCTGKAGSALLIAAFASTAGEIADWVENAAYPNAPQVRNSAFRTSYAPTAPIYVCYFSGSWAPPVGPPGPGQTERPIDYDRARYFIDANGKEVPPSTIGSSGPSAYLPLVRPGGRF